MASYFSVANNAFYDNALKPDYEKAGTWPDDTVELTPEQAALFYQALNQGARIYFNGSSLAASEPCPDKYHVWDEASNIWMLTDQTAQQKKQDQITEAEITKKRLINDAMQLLSLPQLKLQAGRSLTSEETRLLNAVLDYIDEVSAVDTSTAPDIIWPEPPVV